MSAGPACNFKVDPMKNVSIVGKFSLLLMVAGIVCVIAGLCVGMQMSSIVSSYTGLIGKEMTASVSLSQANRSLQAARATIGEIVVSRNPVATAAALKEIGETRRDFVADMDAAAVAMPGEETIQSLKSAGLRILDEACTETISQAQQATDNRSRSAAQALFSKECQPRFKAVSPAINRLVGKVSNSAYEQSEGLSARSNRATVLTLSGMLLGLAAVLTFGFFAMRSWLARPIQALAGQMQVLAAGNYEIEILGADRRDEVGNMAKAVQVFRDNGRRTRMLEDEAVRRNALTEKQGQQRAQAELSRANEMLHATKSLADALKYLAQGDLTQVLGEPFAADFEQVREDFNETTERLSGAFSVISGAAISIDARAREVSRSAADLSRRTEKQAASLEESAAALDEITTSVMDASRRVEEVRTVALDANKRAQKSSSVVDDAIKAMAKIEESSNHISNTIGVIDEIAFQTNLLALNAGVEASRAGQAGNGFAVVAQEVRSLAQRSAVAAREIKELIGAAHRDVANGVALVTEAATALKQIDQSIGAIGSHIDVLSVSSKEQSARLSEVNVAITEMDATTQKNAAMVEEVSSVGETLAIDAERLRERLSQYQLRSTGLAVSETDYDKCAA
jgi:methyl-accepting chemotaxis protein